VPVLEAHTISSRAQSATLAPLQYKTFSAETQPDWLWFFSGLESCTTSTKPLQGRKLRLLSLLGSLGLLSLLGPLDLLDQHLDKGSPSVDPIDSRDTIDSIDSRDSIDSADAWQGR